MLQLAIYLIYFVGFRLDTVRKKLSINKVENWIQKSSSTQRKQIKKKQIQDKSSAKKRQAEKMKAISLVLIFGELISSKINFFKINNFDFLYFSVPKRHLRR